MSNNRGTNWQYTPIPLRLCIIAIAIMLANSIQVVPVTALQQICRQASIRGATFSPDGKVVLLMMQLLSSWPNNRYILRETATGKELWSTVSYNDQYSVAFHPTLPQVLIGTNWGGISLDLATGAEIQAYPFDPKTGAKEPENTPIRVGNVQYSPDGTRVFVAKSDQLMVWSLAGKLESSHKILVYKAPYENLSVSDSSKYTLLGNENEGEWQVWDLEQSKVVQTLTGIEFARFIPRSNNILAIENTSSNPDPNALIIYNTDRVEVLKRVPPPLPKSRYSSLAPRANGWWQFSKSGKYALVASSLPTDNGPRRSVLLNFDTFQAIPLEFVGRNAFSPSSDHIFSIEYKEAKGNWLTTVWDLENSKPIYIVEIPFQYRWLSFWGNANKLMYVLGDETIGDRMYIMDLATKTVIQDFCVD